MKINNSKSVFISAIKLILLYIISFYSIELVCQNNNIKRNDSKVQSDSNNYSDSTIRRISNTNSDTIKRIDSTAFNCFNDNLNEVYKWIFNTGTSNIYNAIQELENITGIYSDSSGDYAGKYEPTIEDYNAWKRWLENNKFNLCWDFLNRKMKLCNTVR